MRDTNYQVLVVAADPDKLQSLGSLLFEAGYDARLAADGPAAMERIAEDLPDFLIVNTATLLIDGPAICEQVRSLNPKQYVYQIIHSDRQQTEDIVRGLEASADAYLRDPVCPAELLAQLQAGARIIHRERSLSRIASVDSLTGLSTKRSFDETLQREWSRARRHDQPLSCVILDIDFFKPINDLHGHPAGDAVLKRVADTLLANSRISDTLCRFGGEEFVALLPQTDEENATLWAERQRETIAQQVFDLRGRNVSITCSFGVAELNPAAKSADEIVEAADQALLFAKDSGRNCVVSHSVLHAAAANPNAPIPTDPFEGVQAHDLMTVVVAPFSPDETIGQAASHFLRSRTSSAPVVENGKLVGLLSEKDLINVMLSPGAWQTPIRQHMKTSVACYDATAPITTIYEFLSRVSVRQVVIVADGRPTGIVSRECLVRWFTSWAEAHSTDAIGDTASSVQPAISDWVAQLSQLAAEITQRAAQLQRDVCGEPSDLVPKLVSGASQIEAALADLLSYSRFANLQELDALEIDG